MVRTDGWLCAIAPQRVRASCLGRRRGPVRAASAALEDCQNREHAQVVVHPGQLDFDRRPQELLALQWDDVLGEHAKLFVARKNVDGELLPYLMSGARRRNRRHRRVDLFEPLAVSLLVWEGRTMLEVAAQAGHGVDVCELYYARIVEATTLPAQSRPSRLLSDPKARWTSSGATTTPANEQ